MLNIFIAAGASVWEKPNLYSYHANRKFKWKSLIPAVSVYAGINIDQQGNPYTAPDVDGISPKVMIATQNNFAGGWVLVMNFIKDRIGSDYYDFEYIVTLTHSFDPQWVVFGETQGIKGNFYSDNLIRFGGAYLWTPNFQLDTAVTFNTKDTPSVFSVNFGASYRLDFHKDKEIELLPILCDIRNEERINQILSKFQPNIIFHCADFQFIFISLISWNYRLAYIMDMLLVKKISTIY